MFILRIEHSVTDFSAWEKAFNKDPVGRQQGGVVRYRVSRGVEDPNHVTIDLEFETVAKATAFEAALRRLWTGVPASLIGGPQTRLLETVMTG